MLRFYVLVFNQLDISHASAYRLSWLRQVKFMVIGLYDWEMEAGSQRVLGSIGLAHVMSTAEPKGSAVEWKDLSQ